MCAAKAARQKLRVYDVFDMLPPPSEQDGEDMRARYEEIVSGKAKGLDGGLYYLYEQDLRQVVEDNFACLGYPIARHNVELIKGKVQDTLAVDEPVAFANIDVDWYEPVMACLERIVPNLVPGGAVALRTYSSWSGCRKAANTYFERVDRQGLSFDVSLGHMVVTRVQP
jgi:asparagine synthase (glutamine-hydrolysing)